jgi:prepilin-type N-terminal cleavage/methylation domain-containing protein
VTDWPKRGESCLVLGGLGRSMMRKERGFTLVEVMVVMLIIFIVAGMMIPLMRSAILRAHVGAMAADAKSIHLAFKRFYIDNDMYPNSENDPAFQLDSFEPLVAEGYYDRRVASKLDGEQADGVDSPDDQGLNQEFWLELTLKYNPNVRFLIAESDNAPLGGGDYYDGIYMYKGGVLTPLTSPVEY